MSLPAAVPGVFGCILSIDEWGLAAGVAEALCAGSSGDITPV